MVASRHLAAGNPDPAAPRRASRNSHQPLRSRRWPGCPSPCAVQNKAPWWEKARASWRRAPRSKLGRCHSWEHVRLITYYTELSTAENRRQASRLTEHDDSDDSSLPRAIQLQPQVYDPRHDDAVQDGFDSLGDAQSQLLMRPLRDDLAEAAELRADALKSDTA